MTDHLTRRKADQTGRSTGKFADPRFKKLNAPPAGEPWVWLTKPMLESFAWRVMSGGAQKVLSRIVIEHLAQGGCQNGDLAVTYADFENYGVGSASVAPALAEIAALGFVERTTSGQKAWGAFKGRPARYRLNWLPAHNSAATSDRWNRFGSLREARICADAARKKIADHRGGVRRQANFEERQTPTKWKVAAE